jgi:D-glycero-alpha-D-manno-heptose 1-phosphate guanylyltransferase
VSSDTITLTPERAAPAPSSLAAIPAVVLAGGLGTRLRAVVQDRPKVLAEVGGRPFLHFQLDRLAASGVRTVVLAVGHLGDAVEASVGDGARFALDVRYSRERALLGTGGAVALALRESGAASGGAMLILNGDSLFDVPLGDLVAHHRASGAKVTLAAARVADAGRYGSLELDAAGRVRRFLEKGADGSGRINAGIYVLDPEVLHDVPLDRQTSLERDIFPVLAAAGALAAMPWDGWFVDIGVPHDLAALDADPTMLLAAVRATGTR